MNSAWMSGQRIEAGEVNDYGALILGEPQFFDALQGPIVEGADLSIAVMHHPFDWLSDLEGRRYVEQQMARAVHFILRGHEHEAQVTIPSGTGGSCAIVSAGSCYDRREYANGYNFVHVNFDSAQGTVYLRRWDFKGGFQKDTATTGDETPGYHEFPIPKTKSARSRLSAQESLEVRLVTDYRDPAIVEALEIYDRRIPASERFEAPDIIRWLREDQEQRKASNTGPWDYFVVALTRGKACGFTLMHYYPKVQLAFVAHLVVERGISIGTETVSHKLCSHIAELVTHNEQLRDCKGFVFEVDDPVLAASEDERRERLARIRLFSMLAEACGITLRALEFDYQQPSLTLPRTVNQSSELPMLLVYGSPRASTKNSMGKKEVVKLLRFIFEWLYPEGFSDSAQQNLDYRKYLRTLCRAQSAKLPERISLLTFSEIRTRRGRLNTG